MTALTYDFSSCTDQLIKHYYKRSQETDCAYTLAFKKAIARIMKARGLSC
jgi:hypothetical protein